MAVDDDRVPLERFPSRGDFVHVVAELRVLTLAERVDVDDRAQIIELVIHRDVGRFPHRSFGHFTVAKQHVGSVLGTDPTRVERSADRRADALAERASRDIDERQSRRRVAFEIRIDPAELQQLFARKQTGFGPRGVQNRRGVSFRQHESIVVRIPRIVRVVAHLREEERRHDLGGRQARGRMAAARFARRAHGVDSQLGGEVLERGERCRHGSDSQS